MSQHCFETTAADGQLVAVLGGWDRRLSGFFVMVELLACEGTADKGEQGEGEDQYLYSNLSDPNLIASMGYADNLEYFEGVLEKLGIKVPQAMLDGIREDAAQNVGNKLVSYDSAGVATIRG